MKATSKTILVVCLATLAGWGWHEHGVMVENRNRIESLNHRIAEEKTRLDTVDQERDAAVLRLKTASVAAESTPVSPAGDPIAEQLDRFVAKLRAKLQEAPDQQIPELALLTEEDWYRQAALDEDYQLDHDHDRRAALAQLRRTAKGRITHPLWSALQGYLHAHDDLLPKDVMELAPYFAQPLAPAILQRYEIVQQGRYRDLPLQKTVLDEVAPVDPDFDYLLVIKRVGEGHIFAQVDLSMGQAKKDLERAAQAFRAANSGQAPTDSAQLQPYLSKTVDPDDLRRNWKRLGFGSN
jgi:hypothetical protein